MCNFGWTGWCRILEPETNVLCVEFVGWYCSLIITSHMMCVMIYIDTNICCLTVPMIFPYWSKLTCAYYVHIITIRIFLVELVDIVYWLILAKVTNMKIWVIWLMHFVVAYDHCNKLTMCALLVELVDVKNQEPFLNVSCVCN